MSADNGVYVVKFPDGFRFAYAAAIDNIDYYPAGSEERKDYLKDTFGKSPVFAHEDEVLIAAHHEAKKHQYLEYGVSMLGEYELWDQEEVKEEKPNHYNNEWYTLRNIKPTEMQLWAGDKRLVNIQGKYSDELEEFVRMANLGIVAHREEIKRRIESMLDYDPKDVAFSSERTQLNITLDDSETQPQEVVGDIMKSFVPTGNEGIVQIELCGVRIEDGGSCNIVVSPSTMSDKDIDNACHFYSVYKRHVDGRAIHMVDAPSGTKRHEAIATASKLARDFNVPFKDDTVFHVS